MRFSLASFLVFLLIAAMVAIYFYGKQRIELTQRRIGELSAEITNHQPQYQRARHKGQILRQTMATPIDTSHLAAAEAKFQQLQQQYGELTVVEPAEVWIVSVPMIDTADEKHVRWNVYVPDSTEIELVGMVVDRSGKQVSEPTRFTPPDFVATLATGKSTIEVTQYGKSKESDSFRYVVAVNDDEFRWETLHTTKRSTASQSNEMYLKESAPLKKRPSKRLVSIVDFESGRSNHSLQISLRKRP